jgi:hypothetical protein
MKRFRIIFILAFIFILTSFSADRFKGEWNYSDKIKLSFFGDNEFRWEFSNNKSMDFFGTYFIKADFDSLILNTQFGWSIPYKFQFVNNALVLWNEKGNTSETKGHIDEIFTFIKNGDDKPQVNTDLKKDIFKFPSNFIGDVFISYNQKGTGNKFYDSQNNRIIEVPDNGLVKTEFKDLILPFALGLYEFESPVRKYTFFIQDLIKDVEIKSLESDSIYVCVYGYNQTGRKEINKLYGEAIYGNVLMLKVDTLKNILKTINDY